MSKVIAISAIFLFSCQEALDQHVTQTHFIESGGEEPQVDPKDVPYIHPMANSLIEGKMPFFEINEFQDGRAIAIGDEVVVSSDKEEFHLSGVVGLETGFDHNPVEKAVQNLNHEKISGGLAEWLGKNSNEKVAIKVYIERPSGFDTIFHRLEKEIARGNVLTFQDKDDAYDRALVAHQAIVKTQLLDLERTIKDIGGITLSKATNLFSLHALLSRSQILNLEKRQEITSLDLLDLKTNEGIVDGAEVIDGTQLFQYLDTSNYYNGDPFGIPLRFGIQEWKPIDDKHPAFLDWNSSSSSRIKKLWSCASGLCTAVSTFGTFPQNSHPTLVSGIALGDLMDGQDSSVTTYDARKARSGYARESDFYYYYGVNTGQFDTTIDRAISDNLALWSSSGGFGSTVNDINCKGETGGAKDLNSLYDSGTIPFFLAGNYGHLSATDCTLWHPASAIGAFVVGGHSQPNLLPMKTMYVTEPVGRVVSRVVFSHGFVVLLEVAHQVRAKVEKLLIFQARLAVPYGRKNMAHTAAMRVARV